MSKVREQTQNKGKWISLLLRLDEVGDAVERRSVESAQDHRWRGIKEKDE